MAQVNGVVYSPPSPQFPHVAVVFGPDGEVLSARKVSSVAAGEALLAAVMEELQAKIDRDDS